MHDPNPQDGRLVELARLGQIERQLELDLVRVRGEIAHLIMTLLAAHATQARIQEVVVASGSAGP